MCVHGDSFYGTEEEEISGCDTHTDIYVYTVYMYIYLLVDTFTAGLSLNMKTNVGSLQTFP